MDKKFNDTLELESEEALLLPDRVALNYFDPSNSATVVAQNGALALNAATILSASTATANQGIAVIQV